MNNTVTIVTISTAELDKLIRSAVAAGVSEALSKLGIDTKPCSDELWDAKQVGVYLQVSAFTIQSVWCHRKGFPVTISLGGGARPRKRWRAEDVMEWVKHKKSW
jgi:predicted DNA-binding transcriptional regulator AlpA